MNHTPADIHPRDADYSDERLAGGADLAPEARPAQPPDTTENEPPTTSSLDAVTEHGDSDATRPSGAVGLDSLPLIDLRFDVPLVVQPDPMTCWAASIAMVRSYRDQASFGVDEVAGPRPHAWMRWSEIEPIALSLGFIEVAPADLQPEGWHNLLAEHGPLWIVVKANVSSSSSHAVVLTGISGDGSLDATRVLTNNPAGTIDDQQFLDFAAHWDFGASAGASIFAST